MYLVLDSLASKLKLNYIWLNYILKRFSKCCFSPTHKSYLTGVQNRGGGEALLENIEGGFNYKRLP